MRSIFPLIIILFLTACNATDNDDKEMTPPAGDPAAIVQNPENTELQRADSDSVLFKATGNEPFWLLQIDHKDSIQFNFLDDITFHTSMPVALDPEKSEVHFKLNMDSVIVDIRIMHQECVDDMSGFVLPYSVIIDVQKTTGRNKGIFNGCGKYP